MLRGLAWFSSCEEENGVLFGCLVIGVLFIKFLVIFVNPVT